MIGASRNVKRITSRAIYAAMVIRGDCANRRRAAAQRIMLQSHSVPIGETGVGITPAERSVLPRFFDKLYLSYSTHATGISDTIVTIGTQAIRMGWFGICPYWAQIEGGPKAMLFNRTNSCVAIGLILLLLLAAPSHGQGPLGFQIFAPADVSTFGGGQPPNEGYFFQFDGLYWSISAPKVVPIGYPGSRLVSYGIHPTDDTDPISDERVQTNTLDTSGINGQFSAGNRIEFGRIEDRNGWLVSIYQQRDLTQDNTYGAADMVFNDPVQGPRTQSLAVRQRE